MIRDRVIDEVGGRSGTQLRASLEGALDAALQGVHEIPSERVIKRSGHPRMRFGEFVASRNVEFGVHTMDIAQATGRPEHVHPASGAVIRSILDGLLGEPLPDAVPWDDTTYILTATSRRPLAPDDRPRLGALTERFPLLS